MKDVKLDLDHKTVAELDKAFGNDVRKPFLDTLKSEMSRRFPKENTSVATSFQVLGLQSLSFLSPNEREDYGLQGLNIRLDHFTVDQDCSGMTPVVSKALVSRSACIVEFALAKRVILEQRYPRDNTSELWRIMNEHHKDQFPNLVRQSK